MPSRITFLAAPSFASGFSVTIGSGNYLNISGMSYTSQSYTVRTSINGINNNTSITLKIKDPVDGGSIFIIFPGEHITFEESTSTSTREITIWPCVKMNLDTSLPT